MSCTLFSLSLSLSQFALSFLFLLLVALVGATDEDGEPFNKNPKYNYAFAVEDKEENVFQAHKQKLDDKVSLWQQVIIAWEQFNRTNNQKSR